MKGALNQLVVTKLYFFVLTSIQINIHLLFFLV